ncbi:MAG: hypothetical protein RLZZ387_764 [Chloroflexota bacterium]|jgi:DNA-binding MarR family transcriptional regulator
MGDTPDDNTELARRVGHALGSLLADVMQYSARDMLSLVQREDLSMPRMTTLMMLARCDGASISDIKQHLNLSLGATSHLVDKLVDGGFVTRAEATEDRRQKHVALTERGRTFAEEVRRIRVEELTRRLAQLPVPLLEEAMAVLGEVQAHLRGAPEAPPSSRRHRSVRED